MGLLEAARKIATPKMPDWLPDVVHAAAHVEGYNTSLKVCQQLVDGSFTGPIDADELTFLLNMIQAYMFVIEHNKDTLDVPFICNVNRMVGRELFKDAGRLRTEQVYVGTLRLAPPRPEYPVVARDVIMMGNKEDLIDRALAFFCYICKQQLFIDGNKRTAQLICNKILTQCSDQLYLCIPWDMNVTFGELLYTYYITNDSYDLKQWLKRNALKLKEE